MIININDIVRVKLTGYGKEILRSNYEERNGVAAAYVHKRFIGVEEKDGWSEWQLWDLMAQFGAYLYNGCELAFETDIEIVGGLG